MSSAEQHPRPALDTAREIADWLRVTPRWVYQQVEQHDMPAYRLGARALRFDRAAVLDWLEATKVGNWLNVKSCAVPISHVPLSMEQTARGESGERR